MVNAIYPFYKLLMLKREGKALRGYRIGGQGVYNTFRMTGEFGDEMHGFRDGTFGYPGAPV